MVWPVAAVAATLNPGTVHQDPHGTLTRAAVKTQSPQ
jgi:hypothetical protein